jgi:hypothetical protein
VRARTLSLRKIVSSKATPSSVKIQDAISRSTAASSPWLRMVTAQLSRISTASLTPVCLLSELLPSHSVTWISALGVLARVSRRELAEHKAVVNRARRSAPSAIAARTLSSARSHGMGNRLFASCVLVPAQARPIRRRRVPFASMQTSMAANSQSASPARSLEVLIPKTRLPERKSELGTVTFNGSTTAKTRPTGWSVVCSLLVCWYQFNLVASSYPETTASSHSNGSRRRYPP